MKKVLFIAALCALAASCSRIEAEQQEVTGESRILQVCASLPATRFSADRGKVAWEQGDEIAVYNSAGEKFVLTLSEGAGTNYGQFSGSFSGSLDTDLAIHPAAFAGREPGTVSIPKYLEASDKVPAVMASTLDVVNKEVRAIRFHHIMAVMEFTVNDIPAYARAVRLVSNTGAQLCGDCTVNATMDGVNASQGSAQDGTNSCVVYFNDAGGSVSLCVPLPAFDYKDLSFMLIDGDEDPVEGTTLVVPQASSSLKSGDYVAMKPLDARALIGDARDAYVKVHGVRWASGNLLRDQSVSRDGWVPGWGLHSRQWEGGAVATVSDSQKRYDHFNWGGISAASYQTDSVVVYPNTGAATGTKVAYFTYIWPRGGALDIQAKSLRYWDGTTERDFDYSLLDGTGKGAPYFFYSGNNDGAAHPKTWETGGSPATVKTFSSYYGDLAWWASKGEFMLPGASDFETLRSLANQQAGYIDDGGIRCFGVLFTTRASWERRHTDLTFRALSPEQIEGGLFLPLAGYRKPVAERDIDTKAVLANWSPGSSSIAEAGKAGAYWSSAITAKGAGSRCPQMLLLKSGGQALESMLLGEELSSESISISPKRSCNVFSTPAGLSIRPVMVPVEPSNTNGSLPPAGSEQGVWD
ncbi:MAG: hypothetical protein IJP55_04935 [Bacteroidales bacterium]|nr:hypothetical protein [Bacteroidales bacterium]